MSWIQPSSVPEPKCKPRTTAERRAYTEGYSNAVADVATSGLQDAVRWALDMIELDHENRDV